MPRECGVESIFRDPSSSKAAAGDRRSGLFPQNPFGSEPTLWGVSPKLQSRWRAECGVKAVAPGQRPSANASDFALKPQPPDLALRTDTLGSLPKVSVAMRGTSYCVGFSMQSIFNITRLKRRIIIIPFVAQNDLRLQDENNRKAL